MKLYIAGPDVFLETSVLHSLINRRKEYLKELGLIGLFPCDGDIVPKEQDTAKDVATRIYIKNMEMLRECDAVIANLSPFRGAGCDPGTAFEVGVARAIGKPVFGWTEDLRPYAIRQNELEDDISKTFSKYTVLEDFNLFENLMLAIPLAAPVAGTFEEAALRAALWKTDNNEPKQSTMKEAVPTKANDVNFTRCSGVEDGYSY